MYTADANRYTDMIYNRCGASGLKLPAVSLGLWHNFGDTSPFENMKALCFTAFDHGITHFDLANNYGPEPGAAERNFGRILREEFGAYRDELIISTKAGYTMWDGPYGDWGSRKYLLSSLDASLSRLGLDYVDIFYHHRPDPETPLEETMGALAQAVRSGKALYAGLSNYDGARLEAACAILTDLGCPFIINQNRYSIFDRTIERNGLKEDRGQARQGHHCVQSSGAGTAYGSLSQGHSRRQPHCDRRQIPACGRSDPRAPVADSGTFRYCRGARPVFGADGSGLGSSRRRCDFGSDRCFKARADSRQPRRPWQCLVFAGRA